MNRKDYRKTEYYKKSISLFKCFVDIILDGDIDRLMTYCFDELKYAKGFSTSQNKENFDCDNLQITKAIYCILWGHLFDIKEGDIGSWNNTTKPPFRGDTINTFNTLFGDDRYGNIAFRAQNRGLNKDFYLWKDIMAFHYEYHTLGNFILIPNKGDVNRKRVKESIGDYFDLFLLDLKKYNEDELNNKNLKECLDENPFYKKSDIFQILKNEFFLEDYFEENNNPKYVFPEKRAYKYFEKNIDIYKDFCHKYIKKSEEIISKRTRKMIETLKSELSLQDEKSN